MKNANLTDRMDAIVKCPYCLRGYHINWIVSHMDECEWNRNPSRGAN